MTGPQVSPPLRPDPPAPASTHGAVIFLWPVAPPGGGSSPARVVFTVGSPPRGSTPPLSSRCRRASGDSQGQEVHLPVQLDQRRSQPSMGVGLVIKGWSQTSCLHERLLSLFFRFLPLLQPCRLPLRAPPAGGHL